MALSSAAQAIKNRSTKVSGTAQERATKNTVSPSQTTQQRYTRSSGGGSSSSGGGSTSSSSISTAAQSIKAASKNLGTIEVSKPTTIETINQRIKKEEFNRGGSFSGTPGTSVKSSITSKQKEIFNLDSGTQTIRNTPTGQDINIIGVEKTISQKINTQNNNNANRNMLNKLAMTPQDNIKTDNKLSFKEAQQMKEARERRFREVSTSTLTISNQKIKNSNLGRDFIRGATLDQTMKDDRFTLGEQIKSGQVNPLAATAGIGTGIFLASTGGAAAVGGVGRLAVSPVGQGIGLAAKEVGTQIWANPFGRFAAVSAASLGIGFGVSEGTQIVGRNLQSKEDQAFLKSDRASQLFSQTQRNINQERELTPTLEEQVSFQRSLDTVRQDLRNQGSSQGLRGQELESFINKNVKNTLNVERANLIKTIQDTKKFSRSEADTFLTNLESGKQKTNFNLAGFQIDTTSAAEGISLFFQKDDIFKRNARKALEGRGLTKDQIDRQVNLLAKEKKIRATGELAGLIAIETVGEVSGQGIISNTFKQLGNQGITFTGKKAGFELFKTGFKKIAPIGFSEGFSGSLIQDRARGTNLDVGKALGAGAIGFTTAGLFGGAVLGTSLKSPGKSAAIQAFGSVLDPLEPVGDILGGRISKTIGIKSPRVFATGSLTDTISFGKGKTTNALTFNFKPSTNVPTLATTNEPTFTPSFANTPANNSIFSNVPIFANVPAQTNTNVPTQANTNIFVGSPTFSNVPANVPANASVPVNVPVFSPIGRLPPPFPLPDTSNLLGGFGGRKSNKGSKFVNELSIGIGLLGGFTGTRKPIKINQKTTKTKTKKSKKKKTLKRNTNYNNSSFKVINPFIF